MTITKPTSPVATKAIVPEVSRPVMAANSDVMLEANIRREF